MTNNNPSVLLKRKGKFKRNIPYFLIALPSIIYLIIFNYVPMYGVIIAFKDYSYAKGIMASPWAGFKHFEYFFTSNDAFRVLRNTILYSIADLLIIGLFMAMLMAILLYEINSKVAGKVYQTAILLPYYLSWVVIAGIVTLFLNHSSGFINQVLVSMGFKKILWYTQAKYWPVILIIAKLWREAGMASLYFYSAIIGIDTGLFEAASLDGAGRLKQIWYVTIPELAPMASMVLITRLGGILSSELGLFYNVTLDNGLLYPTTDVLSTYLYRGLSSGSFSATAAVGLFTSVVGIIMTLITNGIIKKINSENALY